LCVTETKSNKFCISSPMQSKHFLIHTLTAQPLLDLKSCHEIYEAYTDFCSVSLVIERKFLLFLTYTREYFCQWHLYSSAMSHKLLSGLNWVLVMVILFIFSTVTHPVPRYRISITRCTCWFLLHV